MDCLPTSCLLSVSLLELSYVCFGVFFSGKLGIVGKMVELRGHHVKHKVDVEREQYWAITEPCRIPLNTCCKVEYVPLATSFWCLAEKNASTISELDQLFLRVFCVVPCKYLPKSEVHNINFIFPVQYKESIGPKL